ncbi:MAG: esterase-like activity of phytase family protein [Thermomicrobiales bacterium]
MTSAFSFLGVSFLPGWKTLDGAPVGGLSGIDFQPETGRWVIVTDDRASDAPARAYDAEIGIDERGFGPVDLTGTITFRQADGSPYPTIAEPGVTPDLESIRFDPANGHLWFASEGNPALGAPPELVENDADGRFLRALTLPERFHFQDGGTHGARPNLTTEGLCFAADGASLWTSMEGPLFQDGDLPNADHGAPVRFIQLDRDGNALREVVYVIDPLVRASDAATVAGVSEILAIDDERLLVLERQAIDRLFGIPDFTVRLYEATLTAATDVRDVDALPGAEYTPVARRLLADLGELGIGIVTNVEGMCWGPTLANGHRSLVLVADNNLVQVLPSQLIGLDAGEL